MTDSQDNGVPNGHYKFVVGAIMNGRVIPFLGAGVNTFSRPPAFKWTKGNSQFAPTGTELAEYLAETFDYPPRLAQVYCRICNQGQPDNPDILCHSCAEKGLYEKPNNLTRISQYVYLNGGAQTVDDTLHNVFDIDYPPTPLHEFLASLPSILKEKSCSQPYQLIVTTNYDDLLERAFEKKGEAYDVISYIASGEEVGKFKHLLPDGSEKVINKPNAYESTLDQRSLILKIHGAVDRKNREKDSFVITEDNYVDYLAKLILPATLMKIMKQGSFLFLGYGLRDWNLRVILKQIWSGRRTDIRSWAIQKDTEPMESSYWRRHDVDILSMSLEKYIYGLQDELK